VDPTDESTYVTRVGWRALLALAIAAGMSACASLPDAAPADTQPPVVLVPARLAGDPEYRPCAEALARCGGEAQAPVPEAAPAEPSPRVHVAVVLDGCRMTELPLVVSTVGCGHCSIT
jgi:hypothetical protein